MRHLESAVFTGIQNHLCPLGYDTLFLQWNKDLRVGARLLEGLVDRRVEGVLLFHQGADSDYQYLIDLQKHGLPVVVIDRDVNVEGVSFVGPDNAMATTQAMEHLIDLGHQTIAYVYRAEDVALSTSIARYEAYSQIMNAHGFSANPKNVIPTNVIQPSCDPQWFRQFLADTNATAILANNDVIASYFLMAAHKYGLSVPDDFSLVSIGNLQTYIQALQPALTTVDLQAVNIGVKAAELLLELNEAKRKDGPAAIKPQRLVLPTSLVVRETTAPCRTLPVRSRARNKVHE